MMWSWIHGHAMRSSSDRVRNEKPDATKPFRIYHPKQHIANFLLSIQSSLWNKSLSSARGTKDSYYSGPGLSIVADLRVKTYPGLR